MAKITSTPAPKKPRKSAPVAPAVARPIKFYIADAFRPSAGERLAAHTAVFLEAFGLLAGKAVPTATAKTIIGARAVKWHSDNGNFISTPQGLALSVVGVAAFSRRQINEEYRAAYEQVLIEGQCSDAAGVKNPAFIKTL